jgi:hypothetical protein
MSIQDWAIAAASKGIIRDAEKDGRIAEAVVIADATVKGFFPSDARTIKQLLVQFVIFPFCRLLLKDDVNGYEEAKKGL